MLRNEKRSQSHSDTQLLHSTLLPFTLSTKHQSQSLSEFKQKKGHREGKMRKSLSTKHKFGFHEDQFNCHRHELSIALRAYWVNLSNFKTFMGFFLFVWYRTYLIIWKSSPTLFTCILSGSGVHIAHFIKQHTLHLIRKQRSIFLPTSWLRFQ